MRELSSAEKAVVHVLQRMQQDGRVAYLMGWGTESFAVLTKAEAERTGMAVEEFRERFSKTLRPTRVVENLT